MDVKLLPVYYLGELFLLKITIIEFSSHRCILISIQKSGWQKPVVPLGNYNLCELT